MAASPEARKGCPDIRANRRRRTGSGRSRGVSLETRGHREMSDPLHARQTNPKEGGATFPLRHRLARLAWSVVWKLLGSWSSIPFFARRPGRFCACSARAWRTLRGSTLQSSFGIRPISKRRTGPVLRKPHTPGQTGPEPCMTNDADGT